MLISLRLREWRNWQTRTVQVRVPVRAWGFKSPLAHSGKAPEKSGAFFVSEDRRSSARAMTSHNAVVTAIDTFARKHGFVKKSGAWYRSAHDLVFVIQAQRSQYGPKYYLNLALGLRAVDPSEFPQEHRCQIRTRAEGVLPSGRQALGQLLDFAFPLDDEQRGVQLGRILEIELLPIVKACGSVEMLTEGEGKRLVEGSLVTGPAQSVLRDAGFPQFRSG